MAMFVAEYEVDEFGDGGAKRSASGVDSLTGVAGSAHGGGGKKNHPSGRSRARAKATILFAVNCRMNSPATDRSAWLTQAWTTACRGGARVPRRADLRPTLPLAYLDEVVGDDLVRGEARKAGMSPSVAFFGRAPIAGVQYREWDMTVFTQHRARPAARSSAPRTRN